MGLFKMDKILVSTEEFFALHRGIAEASNDPCFGLKLGSEERVERYDPVKIAAISARSFRDAIERISRYKQLTCPEEIRVVERGKESAVQFLWLLAMIDRKSTRLNSIHQIISYAVFCLKKKNHSITP